jgi:hypothetical protein
MRRLIADLYKIVYKKTGSKIVSFFSALIYITALNLLTVYGLLILLEDWLPQLSYLHKAFVFPYYLITGAAMLSFNFWMMLPLHKLSEEVDVKPITKPIIIYSLASALLYGYALLVNHVI